MAEQNPGWAYTAEYVSEGIDLTGKHAVITGAAAGLGRETARVLALRGATVTIVARDAAKAQLVCDEIRAASPEAQPDILLLDLFELDSVAAAAAEYLARNKPIDLLINNAGVMACPLQRNSRGHEMQFATNHLGHFFFTGLLADALVDGGRVVNLSSAAHKFADTDLDDPNFEHIEYDKWIAYGQSKTANIHFSIELNNRLAARGITANAVHPGAIGTDLGRYLTEQDMKNLMDRSASTGFKFKEVPNGAATTVWAATTPDLAGRGGLYLEDCQIAAAEPDDVGGTAPWALNAGKAAQLWTLSEDLVGRKFL